MTDTEVAEVSPQAAPSPAAKTSRRTAQRGPRRVRTPELVAGLVLVVFGALLAAFLFRDTGEGDIVSERVLVAAGPIARGDVIAPGSFVAFEIEKNDAVNAVPATEMSDLVGSIAAVAIDEGVIVNEAQFTAATGLELGEAAIGLYLRPGQYPTDAVRPGDDVVVVHSIDGFVNRFDATVYSVTGSQTLLTEVLFGVSLPESRAEALAGLISSGSVRMILLPGDSAEAGN